MKVAVLGSTGMLGSMVARWLGHDSSLSVVVTARDAGALASSLKDLPAVEGRVLDADTTTAEALVELLADADWVVNAVGVIKPFIRDQVRPEVERAIRVNALFPHLLAKASAELQCRVIQIATDCVYSGAEGGYREDHPHDPADAYGKTKSLGEARADRMFHLRCSIIGPETRAHVSLLDWFLSQADGADVRGFTNHHWNGVTTLQFARLCGGVIKHNVALPHLQHVVPADVVSKADLLEIFSRVYQKPVRITRGEAASAVDRTLATSQPAVNEALWRAAGYQSAPSVEEMVSELAVFCGAASKAHA